MPTKRLNILALFVNLVRNIRLLILFVVAFAVFKHVVIFIVVVGLFLLIHSVIEYLMFKYSLKQSEIMVTSGLIFRKERHIPYQKIQNVQRKQWFFLKPFHVEMLMIDTGAQGSHASRLELTAVNDRIADQIIDRIAQQRKANNQSVNDNKKTDHHYQVKYRIKWPDLLIFAATSLNILTELFIIYSAGERYRINEYLLEHSRKLTGQIAHGGIMSIVLLVIVVILGLILVNIGRVILKYYHFTLIHENNNLEIKRGLLKENTLQLSIKRIQAVEFKQTILRQVFKLATVKIHLIADHRSADDRHEITLIPVLKTKLMYQTVHQFLKLVPKQPPFLRHGDHYMMYLFARNGFLLTLIPVILVGILYHRSLWLILTILLLCLVILNGIYKGIYTRIALFNKQQLILRTARLFTNKTLLVGWHEIQSMKIRQSIWMTKTHRVHLVVAIRSGNSAKQFEYRYLPEDEGRKIFAWYHQFAMN